MEDAPRFAYYQIGVPLTGDAIAQIRRVARGTGRLALQTFESEGRFLVTETMRLDGGIYMDADLHKSCTPVRTPRDGVRCFVGELLSGTTGFADPACTILAVGPSEVGKTVAILVNDKRSGDLREVTEVRRVRARIGNTYYVKQGGACVEAMSKPDLYSLGEPEDFSTYARFDERIGNDLVP